MKQLFTRWNDEFSKEDILQEYPRPIFKRDSYYNLNGEWDLEISKQPKTEKYSQVIQVPYPPEAYLSGVGHVTQPDEYLHYQKTFEVSEEFIHDITFLHLGAVDQECELYLNGQKIGENKGGYLPFALEVTDVLVAGKNVLQIRVIDHTEFKPHARGKQKLYPKGDYSSLFYTPVSGIWKTVWLESVPRAFVKKIHTTPDLDKKAVVLQIETNESNTEEALVEIFFQGKKLQEKTVETNQTVSVKLEKIHPWSPETPNLYDVKITYLEDTVETYFGLRKYSIQEDEEGILRFHLNNKPYYFNGVLDQGYWPEGLLTPPSDKALIYDIQKMKDLGFNTIRKHVKIEPERFYYHCDQIGMIVWQDLPNGGGEYNHEFVTDLPNESDILARNIPDDKYTMFKRDDEEGREQYYADLKGMVETFYNYPSIAMWVPFNEGWGQFDANKATDLVRKLDNTRFIMETSGWFDQGGGDTFSIHNYRHKLKIDPNPERVTVLSEFGGYSSVVEGHQSHEKKFGYQHYQTKEAITENYERLWREDILTNIKTGLSSTIYTQLSDIEEEVNGLLTYDREVDKIDTKTIQNINEDVQKEFARVTNQKTKNRGIP